MPPTVAKKAANPAPLAKKVITSVTNTQSVVVTPQQALSKKAIEQFVKKYFKPSPTAQLANVNKRSDPLAELYTVNTADFPFVADNATGFNLLQNNTTGTLTKLDQQDLIINLLQLHACHIQFTPEYNGIAKIQDLITKNEIPCIYTELRTFFSGIAFVREYSRKLAPKIDPRVKSAKEQQQITKKEKEEKEKEKKRKQAESVLSSSSDVESTTKKQKTTQSSQKDNKLVQLGKNRVSFDSTSSDSDVEKAKVISKPMGTFNRVSFDSTSDSDSDSDSGIPKKSASIPKNIVNNKALTKSSSLSLSSSSSSSSSSSDDSDDSNSDDDIAKVMQKGKGKNIMDKMINNQLHNDHEDEHDAPKKPQGKKTKPMKKYIVFIGNLTYTTTKDEVLERFARWNPISVRMLQNRETGISKGAAFMEFSNAIDMQSVLALEDVEINDRKLNISFAVGAVGKSAKRQELLKEKTETLKKEREALKNKRAVRDQEQRDAQRDREDNYGDAPENEHQQRKSRFDKRDVNNERHFHRKDNENGGFERKSNYQPPHKTEKRESKPEPPRVNTRRVFD